MSKKIQRNDKEPKITLCMGSWDILWITRYRKTKHPAVTSKSQEQKLGVRGKSKVLDMSPALNITKKLVEPPKPPLWPDPWTHPYAHPI